MRKITLIIGLTFLLAACNQKKEIVEKFDKSDLEFFNLNGPVRDFGFIVITVIGDYDVNNFSFESYSKELEYRNITFDKKGFIQSINIHSGERFAGPKNEAIPLRVRTEDTLTIDMNTLKEEKWIKYIFNDTSLSVNNYNRIHNNTKITLDENFTSFSYDLHGSWIKYEMGYNKDSIVESQIFKTITNSKKLDSLVYLVEKKNNSQDRLAYSIKYLEFDSYGNWTKRVLDKHIPYFGYGTTANLITEIRKINYY